MLRALRITLMWLIALAVPVQGFAAVTMFGCSPGHHGGMAASQTVVAQGHEREANDPLHGAMTEDADGQPHDAGVSHNHSQSLKPHGATHKVAKGNCTPCASCCVVAALPATAIQFDPVPLVDFFVLSVQSGVSSFLVDGLERPPRTFSA